MSYFLQNKLFLNFLPIYLFLIFTKLCYSSLNLNFKTYRYDYSSNITNLNNTNPLTSLHGEVYVTSISLEKNFQTNSDINLFYVVFKLKTNKNQWLSRMEAITVHDVQGMIDRIYMFMPPDNQTLNTIQQNYFKGILNLFQLSKNFESSWEYGSSGHCLASYALIEPNFKNNEELMIDKELTQCKSPNHPFDEWNYNMLPVPLHMDRQILTRYRIGQSNFQILEVQSYEKQTLTLTKSSNYMNLTKLDFVSWQHLKYTHQTDVLNDEILNKLKHYTNLNVNNVSF